MSTLQQLRTGLNRAWNHLAEGWRELGERAGQALTHFRRERSGDQLETVEDQLLYRAPSWGLLAAEVRETADNVEIRLEAPGLEPENFELEVVDDSILVVRGEKQVNRQQHQGRYHLVECAYGRFERAIPLPVGVDDRAASARYRRGVLQVTLPKSPAARSRRIPVASP